MPRTLLGLAIIVACGCAWPTHADETETITQKAGVEVVDDVHGLMIEATDPAAARDRHIAVSKKVPIEPFDTRLGMLERVRIELTLIVGQRFSAVVGDGMPLDEYPDAVAGQGRLSSRIDVIAPNGMFLVSETLQTDESGCASSGVCTYEHREGVTLSYTLAPPRAAFDGRRRMALIIRGTGIGGVLSQVCVPAPTWDRCRVDHAQLLIRSPDDGIIVHYDYVPTALANPLQTGLPVDEVVLIASTALLVPVFAWLALHWLRRRQRARV